MCLHPSKGATALQDTSALRSFIGVSNMTANIQPAFANIRSGSQKLLPLQFFSCHCLAPNLGCADTHPWLAYVRLRRLHRAA
jgi:hypothetical protein